MKLQSVYNPIKKCFNVVRNSFRHASECGRNYEQSGAEILAQQNKVLVRPINRVEPERVQFDSTKEMFQYAKKKIMFNLNNDFNPREYTVIMNVKDNKVLAEYIGDSKSCDLSDIESLVLDDKNVVLMHGHPESYPISRADVRMLLKYKINQVIAIDKDGKFSMVARRNDVQSASVDSKEFRLFTEESDANFEEYLDSQNNGLLKMMTHYTLNRKSPSLGVRYLTNYPYLKE